MTLRIDEDGTRFWENEAGQYHREDGAAIEYSNGDKCWWVNGKPHRSDGPAYEFANGHKEWWLDGKYHRLDGPAIEWGNGTKYWYLNGKEYTESEYKELIQI